MIASSHVVRANTTTVIHSFHSHYSTLQDKVESPEAVQDAEQEVVHSEADIVVVDVVERLALNYLAHLPNGFSNVVFTHIFLDIISFFLNLRLRSHRHRQYLQFVDCILFGKLSEYAKLLSF